jgi:hypothetical protein
MDPIRKQIQAIIREIMDASEVMPAKPTTKPATKPGTTPAKPNPRRIIRPKIHPGADPAPKANKNMPEKPGYKKKIEVGNLYQERFLIEKAKYLRLINEAPMDFDNPNQKPHPNIVRSIETGQNHPFRNIDIFNKDNDGQKTIEKLGSEEYRDVQQKLSQHGKVGMMDIMPLIQKLKSIENRNKTRLEQLAKDTVQQNFGIPDEVMENIFVELKNPGEIESDGLDMGFDEEDLADEFTDEEKVIIAQNVPKRIISNTLMMGAGFRAHNLLDKIKSELDRIDPFLHGAYLKLMTNTANLMWTIPPSDEMQLQNSPQNGRQSAGPKAILGGTSKLIMGDDENGDGVREVEGAKAEAIVFPVLMHEVVKSILEYIFANGLPQYTEKVNREIIKQSDKFHFEHWQKLLGPRLWKYLHDAIDFIVQGRESDYTIVAYLLQEISLLEPVKFLKLMDYVLHDGQRAINILSNMVDGIEADLEAQEEQGLEPDEPEDPDFTNMNNLMSQINSILNKPEDEAVRERVLNHKPFHSMRLDELVEYVKVALKVGEFEKAAEARDEIDTRSQ